MENKKLELENLQKEVVEFYTKLGLELETEIGYKIFYSKFSTNADILFIGINPGAGEQGQFKDEEKILEYINDSHNDSGVQINNYSLARETIHLFELAGYPNLLEKLDTENKIVKTNFFYYVDQDTENGSNIKINDFKDKMISASLRDELYKKSYEWTSKIIELSNPKIIICEGKEAYYNVFVCIPQNEISKKETDNVLITKYSNRPFTMLTYKRRFSNIINKEKVAKILKIELDKIYN